MNFELQEEEWDCSPTALLNALIFYVKRQGMVGFSRRHLTDVDKMREALISWCKTDEDGTWDVDLDKAISFTQHQFKLFDLLEDEGNTFILSHMDYQAEGHVTFILGYSEKFGGFNCVNFYAGLEPVVTRITEKRMKAVFELSRHMAKENNEPDMVGWFLSDWGYALENGYN